MRNFIRKDIGWNSERFPYRFLFSSFNLMLYFLHMQTLIVSAFNKQTLQNAHDYLASNKDHVTWEVNESGFVRTRFPMDILDFNGDAIPALYQMNVSVRCNFWYGERLSSANLQDAAAHDHPNGFMSYIVAHGYEHENYHILSRNNTATECVSEDRKGHYCAKLSIFNKKRNHLTHNGTTLLRITDTHQTKEDDIVVFDDHAIHRISKYQKGCLTLNLVRKNGKEKTNIFLFPDTAGEVKQKREVLKDSDALAITEKAITSYHEAIIRLETTEHNQKKILNYTMQQDEFWFSEPTTEHANKDCVTPRIGMLI